MAAFGLVGCSFDAGNLRVSAIRDASPSPDLRIGPSDVVGTTLDVFDSADLPTEAPVITKRDSASEFEAPADSPFFLSRLHHGHVQDLGHLSVAIAAVCERHDGR